MRLDRFALVGHWLRHEASVVVSFQQLRSLAHVVPVVPAQRIDVPILSGFALNHAATAHSDELNHAVAVLPVLLVLVGKQR